VALLGEQHDLRAGGLAGRRPPRRHLLALTLLFSISACGQSSFDAGEATDLAAPHLEHFAGFDRWARRAIVADPAIRDRAALTESVFAPIRREEIVQGAWIAREGETRPLAFGHLEMPPGLSYRTVRDTSLGEIGVSTDKVPDPRTRFDEDAARRRAVFVTRARTGDDGIEVTVTVAYLAE